MDNIIILDHYRPKTEKDIKKEKDPLRWAKAFERVRKEHNDFWIKKKI